ncbi:MAG: DUF4442 domain-containing protein [Thermoanaerobaculia bacterium]|nr:DUF4442 domain-containing protein [Thermoanaerobaculia bacterium]
MTLLARLRRSLKRRLLATLSVYPPYLGAGIRVKRVAKGHFRVSMGLHWYNRNYFGTHFGGSLYSMCDPFFVLALMEHLGSAFEAWDKRSTIHFRRPGRGRVTAEFAIPAERVEQIRREALERGTTEAEFEVEVLGPEGEVVARVEKLVHVRAR